MAISEIDQETQDIEWFALDSTGLIGFFMTGGIGVLPRSVVSSANDLRSASEFFRNGLLPKTSATLTARAIASTGKMNGDQIARCFGDWLKMAERGLYGFDHSPAKVRPTPSYWRVTVPASPLRLETLPPEIQDYLGRTVIADVNFSDCEEIAVGNS